jgi:hypothetical protein
MRVALTVLGVAVLAGWCPEAAAQPSSYELNQARARAEAAEAERDALQNEANRKSAERNAANVAAAEARGRKDMAEINSWPVLPAARNRCSASG